MPEESLMNPALQKHPATQSFVQINVFGIIRPALQVASHDVPQELNVELGSVQISLHFSLGAQTPSILTNPSAQ